MDDPLTVTQGANTFYYHKDGLGSVVNLTDTNGNVVKSYTYKSFGEIYSETGSLVQPFTFTGREYDPESGLYYYRARYYDPRAGRFLTKDPIGFTAGDVNLYRYVDSVGKPYLETNLYLYTGNNPINRIDPLGLDWIDDVGNLSGGFGDALTFGGTDWIRGQWNQVYGWDDSVDRNSTLYKIGGITGYAWWLAFNAAGHTTGREFSIGDKCRVAPWGNRTGNPYGEWPHYHRKGILGPDVKPLPGEGMGRHRPWQPPVSGQPWWKRF